MVGTQASLREEFNRRFPGSPDPGLYRAPGRVNLIGEHTDYNLGYVMPIAIQMACYAASAPDDQSRLVVYSRNTDEQLEWAWDEVATAKPRDHWSDYVIGVAQQLIRAGHTLSPTRLYLYSTVPSGAGLSSSAAIEVASALALLQGQPIDKLLLAQLSQAAERNFVGVPCGIMDQYISVFGEEHSAVQLDCRSLRHVTVHLPDGISFVAVNSMVKHELGSSAYRERVAECGEAAKILSVESLRDATPEQVEAARDRMKDNVYRRARHVTTEDERVPQFSQASREGDLKRMGELLIASHRSLQHDYEVSCEELDFLVDVAITLDGVYGARMTGGGFGGCTVNLVKAGAVDAFQQEITRQYQQRYGVTAQCFVCEPSQGASPYSGNGIS